MPSLPKHIVVIALLALPCILAQAQDRYENIGSPASAVEIQAWDMSIGPDGKELPPGKGSAQAGEIVYNSKCAVCHGINLEGNSVHKGLALVGGEGTIFSNRPQKSVGSYWPFATSLWDYINRAMPRFEEGTLSADEVYAVTAYILYHNGIIGEVEVMDASSLPRVTMPNRYGFIPAKLDEIADTEKRGCYMGHCP